MGWNFDLPRLNSLNKYWKKYPPMQVLFASYVGYKAQEETSTEVKSTKSATPNDAAMAEFFASVPQYKFVPPKVRENGNGSKP